MQELQLPGEKVCLSYDFVEAIEVTPQFVYSLPNAGAILQRFGEQVEILLPGPVPKKSYAVLGEYIIRFLDAANRETYVVLGSSAFKALFQPYEAPASEVVEEEKLEEDKPEESNKEEDKLPPKKSRRQSRVEQLEAMEAAGEAVVEVEAEDIGLPQD